MFLKLHNVVAGYGGGDILQGVDLDVEKESITCIVGPNGAGKSTVMRAVVALQPFESGSITVGDFALRPGRVPPESALKPLRRRIGRRSSM